MNETSKQYNEAKTAELREELQSLSYDLRDIRCHPTVAEEKWISANLNSAIHHVDIFFDVAKRLINEGADSNVTDTFGNNMAHLAAYCGMSTIVEEMGKLGVNLRPKSQFYQTVFSTMLLYRLKEIMAKIENNSKFALNSTMRESLRGRINRIAKDTAVENEGKDVSDEILREKLDEAIKKTVAEMAKKSGADLLLDAIMQSTKAEDVAKIKSNVEDANDKITQLKEEADEYKTRWEGDKKWTIVCVVAIVALDLIIAALNYFTDSKMPLSAYIANIPLAGLAVLLSWSWQFNRRKEAQYRAKTRILGMITLDAADSTLMPGTHKEEIQKMGWEKLLDDPINEKDGSSYDLNALKTFADILNKKSN